MVRLRKTKHAANQKVLRRPVSEAASDRQIKLRDQVSFPIRILKNVLLIFCAYIVSDSGNVVSNNG